MPPVKPMLARTVSTVPTPESVAEGLLYEPKWDGFRCIVFRDGDEVELGSRKERSITRYFPELVEAARAILPPRCVVDGEIVIMTEGQLDFEALLDRIHPAASRVRLLAETTPAVFIAFDLLALHDESLMDVSFRERRARLSEALAEVSPPIFLTPVTDNHDVACRWFDEFEGAGLDGIVAKFCDLLYQPDKRVMLKVKHERTADCVVAGYRWHKSSTPEAPVVGSLLLGLYSASGTLQHVGVAAAFPMSQRRQLTDELAPYRLDPDEEEHPWANWAHAEQIENGDRMPGAQTRWNAKKDLSWVPLRPELVCEVRYDHMEGTRFRHATQFARWRPDRTPDSCTYQQLERPTLLDLSAVLAMS